MALITISGFPSSGKTRRAEQIKAALETRLQDPSYAGPSLKVEILSDEKLNISRDAYKGVRYSIERGNISYKVTSRFTVGKACQRCSIHRDATTDVAR